MVRIFSNDDENDAKVRYFSNVGEILGQITNMTEFSRLLTIRDNI